VSPAGPLETHLALPNRVLEGGVYTVRLRRPFGLFCAAILLCDLRPLAARALTSRPGCAFTGRVPSRVDSQGPFEPTHSQLLKKIQITASRLLITLSRYSGLHAAAHCLVASPFFIEVSLDRAFNPILRIVAKCHIVSKIMANKNIVFLSIQSKIY